MPDRLAYKPGEAAALLGRSRNFIYDEMRRGHLPTLKVGRCRMILHGDLLAYLEARRDPGAAHAS